MRMKVLAIGGGGREHAIVKALAKSDVEIYSILKNKNPGIIRASKEYVLLNETEVDSIVRYATSKGVELAIIGPESPLEAGVVDALEEKGVRCVGPTRSASRIETGKSFARALLANYKIPGNLAFAVFSSYEEAKSFLDSVEHQVVVKPEGLTGGKGVKVEGEHLKDRAEVLAYIKEVIEKGVGGGRVVIEEKVEGEEFSLQAFSDGKHIIPMPLVQDHKRAFEGDKGHNTGGMGSYSGEDHLLPFVTSSEKEKAVMSMRKTIDALASEGTPYKGILYGQFMLTAEGPKIIEFNARFGDPEAMNVLPLLESDFLEICQGIAFGDLSNKKCLFRKEATVCKYVVPIGYGLNAKSGTTIKVDEEGIRRCGAELFYAAVNQEDGRLLTTSSRAVAVVGIDRSLDAAERQCERALRFVSGEEVYVRHDIGKHEVIQRKIERIRSLRK
ncbi:MAG: phosphoribosylamine--glycine ligase [Methanomassiliicoccales archaeon]